MELDGILKIQTKLNNITDRNKLNEEQTKTSLIMPLSNTGWFTDFNTKGPKVVISARGSAGFVNKVETDY